MSTVRSLPEHTVDCWVAMAIGAAFPNAFIWAPTQLGDDNWDAAFECGRGKTFILENKATLTGYSNQPNDHHVHIDLDQLAGYITYPVPVYYVIPDPPWPASSTAATLTPMAPVPVEAGHRSGSNGQLGFDHWARVLEASQLAALRSSIQRSPGIMATSSRPLRVPVRLNITAQNSITLRRFLDGIARCEYGGPLYETGKEARTRVAELIETSRANSYLQEKRKGAGTLAVFIPFPNGEEIRPQAASGALNSR